MFDNLNGEPVTLDHIRKSLKARADESRRSAARDREESAALAAKANAHEDRAAHYDGLLKKFQAIK